MYVNIYPKHALALRVSHSPGGITESVTIHSLTPEQIVDLGRRIVEAGEKLLAEREKVATLAERPENRFEVRHTDSTWFRVCDREYQSVASYLTQAEADADAAERNGTTDFVRALAEVGTEPEGRP